MDWAPVATICSSIVVGTATIVASGRANRRRLSKQVEDVHREIKPPSNNTTTGSHIETHTAQLSWLHDETKWLGDEVSSLRKVVGGKPVSGKPEERWNNPIDVPPPDRPENAPDRRRFPRDLRERFPRDPREKGKH